MIDGQMQGLRATGQVSPVRLWTEDSSGKRQQSDQQEMDSVSGLPMWSIEIMSPMESYGQTKTVVSSVTVPAREMPSPEPYALIAFERLQVQVSVNKSSGQLREFWRAAGLVGSAARSVTKAA
jgi:hypothetical protein